MCPPISRHQFNYRQDVATSLSIAPNCPTQPFTTPVDADDRMLSVDASGDNGGPYSLRRNTMKPVFTRKICNLFNHSFIFQSKTFGLPQCVY